MFMLQPVVLVGCAVLLCGAGLVALAGRTPYLSITTSDWERERRDIPSDGRYRWSMFIGLACLAVGADLLLTRGETILNIAKHLAPLLPAL